ncbi:hypothetical protein B9T29_06145 [Acinetobacter sp. ANC 3903]|jgi:hypothetical protein|uniref:hypothetical protein n=1 Tax=Acinetobacter sp. ANC 3903 TaxID=1977883 RepID=UPI000A332A17|nr:hypothetical protein [Acinetobacter sp. ANC 3903]OTG62798.1 hypothetical protein B9T29_06145 [Acinetobacter sp. ANC 3903]
MDVIGYLHHADFLLEDEQGMAIIGGGNYVLSVGDKVFLRRKIDGENNPRYMVDISFASSNHNDLFEDQCMLKFSGNRAELQQYLSETTVH